MDSKRWQQVKAILDEVFELEGDQRDEMVGKLCAGDDELRQEVLSLLAADDVASDPKLFRDEMPSRIGPFRIERELGAGGMGVVYLAHQEHPIARQVAIKLIKIGMDTQAVISRFQQERQTLALMQHPGIAAVLDAGSTEEGRPYFVMEYVDGIPLTQYCDSRRLDIGVRIRLFLEVCAAIQHAHQKGIIHRDIKPSNVLVTELENGPLPKVIDFGIAKATDADDASPELTIHGAILGTPQYMSPEQTAMSASAVDTRTDVYSLGALLYELLAGSGPYGDSFARETPFDEILRTIRETPPTKPSARILENVTQASVGAERNTSNAALARALRRDLDWIVMRALQKDPARRYANVSDFARDVQRYLRNEPLEAGPPSTAYRVGKFVSRHRAGVGAASVVLIGLLIGIAGSLIGINRARVAEQDARLEAAKSQRVSRFLAEMFEGLRPENIGISLRKDLAQRVAALKSAQEPSEGTALSARVAFEDATRGVNFTSAGAWLLDQEILTPAASAIEEKLGDDPEIVARLYHTLGTAYRRLGLYDSSSNFLARAIEVQANLLGAEHLETLRSQDELGALYRDSGELEASRELLTQVLKVLRRTVERDHPYTIAALQNLGLTLFHQKRLGDSEPFHVQALELTRQRYGEDHQEYLIAMDNLAVLRRNQGRLADAERLYEEVLAKKQRILGPDHADTLATLNNYAVMLMSDGQLDEAERLAEDCLAKRRQVLGDEHPHTLLTTRNLADIYTRQGDHAKAIEIATQALEVQNRTLDRDHPDRLHSLHAIGFYHYRAGDYAAAAPFFTEASSRRQAVLGPNVNVTIYSRRFLGSVRLRLAQYDAAEADLRDSLQRAQQVLGDELGYLALIRHELSESLFNLNRYKEAETLALKALEYRTRNGGGERAAAQATNDLLVRIRGSLAP